MRTLLKKFMSLDPVSKCVAVVFVTVATMYGGSKAPTNPPPMTASLMASALHSPPPVTTSLTNWHARGAWCDWQRLALPEGFRFPLGTNYLRELTLMSYGELRTSLRGDVAQGLAGGPVLARLPAALALAPNVTTVSYGLTSSNTFRIAWDGAFANRDPTNRVNAALEMLESGEIVTTLGNAVGRVAPRPPSGFVGIGQDADWIAATFPEDAAYIESTGYDAWVADRVGYDEQNGRYQVAVTIPALPSSGAPCYLFCGPYKVNVTAPGTYRFPLEVFETYEVRTYPEAIPFSLAYDDGYTGDGVSYEIVSVPDAPRPPLMATASTPRTAQGVSQMLTFYRFYMKPLVIVTPDRVPLSTANGSRISIWCNLAYTSINYIAQELYLAFFGTEAEIRDAYIADWVEIIMQQDRYDCWGEFCVYDDTPSDPVVPEREDATVFVGESPHYEITNGYRSVCLTAVTSGGTMDVSESSTFMRMRHGKSADVYVYLATTESGNDEYDDVVGWTVTANGAVALEGSTSVSSHSGETGGSVYGVSSGAVLLASGHLTPPEGGNLRMRLRCTAQNVGDGKKETCVQIVVVPTE